MPTIIAATPRFQMSHHRRVEFVKQRQSGRSHRRDCQAASQDVTAVGRSHAAWRSIRNNPSESGRLVMISVAKQRAASPMRTPSGPMSTQCVKQP